MRESTIDLNILNILKDCRRICSDFLFTTLQAMTNDSDLNMENNIGKRDTQFFGMFWLKTLEN